MFKDNIQFEALTSKVWLSSPTVHSESFDYMKEDYKTNWISTVGANINAVEKMMAEVPKCHLNRHSLSLFFVYITQ